MTTATAAARFSRSRRRSASLIVFETRDELFQVRDVSGGERTVLGEVGDERRHLAAEKPVDQALALGLDVVRALQQRPVEVPAGLLAPLDGLLAKEARDQGLHRARRPAVRLAHL